jgi:hypothetical protein
MAQRRFRRLGYRVLSRGRGQFAYEERYDGQSCVLEIHGEMEKRQVYLPSEQSWRESVPEWARERRDEIVQRVRQAVGERMAVAEV